jgi:hypothetical protein
MATLKPNLPSSDPRKIVMPGNMKARTMRILLEESEDIPPTGQFIGHNGNSYMLKPGVWVDVPVPILDILDHAVASAPIVDPQTRQIVGWREKLRYPYRVAPNQNDPRTPAEDAEAA